MFLKRFIGLAFAGALAFSAASAEVIVRIAPAAGRGPEERSFTGPRLHVGAGLSELGWRTLHVGPGPMGAAATGTRPLG